MVFSSITFLCAFLPVVFILYSLLPWLPIKNLLLIIASLLFYAYGEPIYVLLMIVSTILNWLLGLGCGRSKVRSSNPHFCKHEAIRKKNAFNRACLVLAIIINLSFLCIFKYADMFIDSANHIAGLSINLPGIALPIGISFYTFQALSYVIDVYRGEVRPQANYFYVLLYISFFPQLIAGPIVKYHDIEKELSNRHAILEDISSGIVRFCVGLSKKVLIANTMANIVDTIYAANGCEINIAVSWLAGVCYIMQIYFDFSGYSDMAIGMAKMFGFHFQENFNYPYVSTTIKEFWRRWHISLSTWFRDYLYIPLGGNRKGKLKASINKIVVFFCCGLWHGANWTFVCWGLGHGLALLVEDYVPIRKLPKVLGWLYTIIVVTILFVVFRADNLEQAGFMISQMFGGFHFELACKQLLMQMLSPINLFTFTIAIIAALKISNILYLKIKNLIPKNTFLVIQFILSICLLVMCVFTLSGGGYNPFIYFRF